MSCKLHKIHRPAALTVEYHHIIPQAWQHFALGSEKLFDRRTIGLCPTSHRNVHFHIVELMHGRRFRKGREEDIARMALDRFQNAGYSLDDLRAHRLWGEA